MTKVNYIDLYDQFATYVGGVYAPGNAATNGYPSVTRNSPGSIATVKLTTSGGVGTSAAAQTKVTAGFTPSTKVFNFCLKSLKKTGNVPTTPDDATDALFDEYFSLSSDDARNNPSAILWAKDVFSERKVRSMLLTYVTDCYFQFSPNGDGNVTGPDGAKSTYALIFVEPGQLMFEEFQYYKAVFIVEDMLIEQIKKKDGTYA